MRGMASKLVKQPYTEDVIQIAQRLGGRIRTARIRRNWRQEDLQARSGLSRSTIQAIERGEPSTSLGSFFQVLWLLGLANEIEVIADPGLDREGLSLALDADRKRVYVARKADDAF